MNTNKSWSNTDFIFILILLIICEIFLYLLSLLNIIQVGCSIGLRHTETKLFNGIRNLKIIMKFEDYLRKK